jgi:thiamine transporter ThiT
VWNRLKKLFRYSMTIFVARLSVVAGVLVEAVALLSDPSVSSGVSQLLPDYYLPYYMIGMGLLTELARRRTLPRNDERGK